MTPTGRRRVCASRVATRASPSSRRSSDAAQMSRSRTAAEARVCIARVAVGSTLLTRLVTTAITTQSTAFILHELRLSVFECGLHGRWRSSFFTTSLWSTCSTQGASQHCTWRAQVRARRWLRDCLNMALRCTTNARRSRSLLCDGE